LCQWQSQLLKAVPVAKPARQFGHAMQILNNYHIFISLEIYCFQGNIYV
jgi:hypothetical protein